MTFEERMAELGVGLSDLPKYKRIPMLVINRKISEWKGEHIDTLDLYRYILHLTDIIDRMETRIVNLTGERDWMQSKCCALCVRAYEDGSDACDTCDIDEGVPEDRRADDD